LYRDEHELNYVQEYDPLAKFRRLLLRYNRATEKELLGIEENVKSIVKEAHQKGLAAAHPTPESIHEFVLPPAYVSSKYPEGTHAKEEGDKKKLIQALNETLKAEFRHNPDTYLWGQDVAHKDKGGIFNVSKGMQQEFGKLRVFNGPIAEDYILGTANGMSRYNKKIRIVVEGAEFADYFWPAMEQFVETTHEYWRTKGQFSPNITVRLASGGYIGGGLYHSQNIEGALTTFPGVRIVYPSFADDAAGLLRTSMRSEGMTVFMEPKALYNAPKAATIVPDDFEVPFGKARVRREGTDLTVVTYGNTTHMCIEAANQIADENKGSVEVIDLRSLIPLDTESIRNSLNKTARVLVVHEDKVFSGFGAEIVATITSEMFELLDAPVRRVGSEFTPVGFNRILEAAVLPDNQKIHKAMLDLLAY
jgi:2-oxoisovalerate dehydrogenase E1 component